MYRYKNGNYFVTILDDGTKVRMTKGDEFVPAFSENMDCKLTDRCSQGCPFCYEGCTVGGSHGDLFKYRFIETLHPYTELAMNGNDLDHPDMERFLAHLKDRKVFGNITVNQNQFIANYDRLSSWQRDGLVHGIGVSLVEATDELVEKMSSVKNTVLHTIVGVLSERDVEKLKCRGMKVLLLGYKDLKRGISYRGSHGDEIEMNKEWLYNNLGLMRGWFDVLSFDNLAIEQLDVKRIVPDGQWEEFYMGDDGMFTFYIDMVKGEFAKNSLSQERYPIGELSVDEMFEKIRNGSVEANTCLKGN